MSKEFRGRWTLIVPRSHTNIFFIKSLPIPLPYTLLVMDVRISKVAMETMRMKVLAIPEIISVNVMIGERCIVRPTKLRKTFTNIVKWKRRKYSRD